MSLGKNEEEANIEARKEYFEQKRGVYPKWPYVMAVPFNPDYFQAVPMDGPMSEGDVGEETEGDGTKAETTVDGNVIEILFVCPKHKWSGADRATNCPICGREMVPVIKE